jgi:hypothetical protein
VNGQTPVTSIAVAGDTLWMAALDQFHRVRAITSASPVPSTFGLTGVTALALGDLDVFLATAQTLYAMPLGAATGSSPSLYPDPVGINLSAGSEVRLAAGNGYAYVLSGNLLTRVKPGAASFASTPGGTDVVAGPACVFFGEVSAIAGGIGLIRVFPDVNPAAELVAPAFSPAVLAHDGTSVYWTDSSSQGTNEQKVIWKFVGGVKTPVTIPDSPTIVGLVVDSQCVYYWGGIGKGKGAIRIAPK